MTIFVLGPARDLRGAPTVLELRRRVAQTVIHAGAEAFVMEDDAERKGENNMMRFQRLAAENHVTTYVLVVPLRTRLHGTSVEIGHLLTRIQATELSASRVHLLLETTTTALYDDGTMALQEEGNRTRYYTDLVDEGCPVHRWSDQTELMRHAVAVAIEDLHLTSENAPEERP